MKRLIVSVILLCIGIFLAVSGYFSLKHICNNMRASLYNVIDAVDSGENDKILSACDEAKINWDKKKSLLGVYTNHSEMDELQIFMKDLKRLAEDEDFDELTENCYECIYHFEHIEETETPNYGNVF